VPLAFSTPIACAEPLRLTFIVGGGKLVRHRYDESLPKWLGAALREAGFADDRGAALGDSKVFKLQHDLGQNLIYMHVFPAVEAPAAAAGAAGAAAGAGDDGAGAGAAAGAAAAAAESPSSRLLTCSLADFSALLTTRIAPWSQRRRLLAALQEASARLAAAEAKLVSRTPLTPEEQVRARGVAAAAAARRGSSRARPPPRPTARAMPPPSPRRPSTTPATSRCSKPRRRR
jgi:hypothetical protein